MKALGQSMVALAAGLAVWTTGTTLQAQDFPLNTQLTIQQQDFTTQKNGVYTDKVKTLRLGTRELLDLLEGIYTTSYPYGFPPGSRLVLMDYSYFQVQTAAGAILVTNASPYLTYSDTYSQTNYLAQGKENTLNGAESYTYFYRSTLQFNNPDPDGTSFTFTGNTAEKYSLSALDVNNRQLYQGSIAITGNGEGKTGGKFFLLSGRISSPTVRGIVE